MTCSFPKNTSIDDNNGNDDRRSETAPSCKDNEIDSDINRVATASDSDSISDSDSDSLTTLIFYSNS